VVPGVRLWPNDDALEESLGRALDAGCAVATDLTSGQDMSWRRFVDGLAPPAPSLDPVEERLALREACARAAAGTPFAVAARGRAFLGAAARLVAEAERAGLTPDQVEEAAGQGGALPVLARAFAELRGLVDGRGWSRDRRRGEARAVAGPALDVRLPLAIEPTDIRLVLQLAELRPVRLHLPWDSARPAIFGGLEPVLSACEAARGNLELVLEDPGTGSPAAACLAALHGRAPASAPPAGWLSLLAAPTPDAELRAIAAAVRTRIDEGVPPEEIAVVVRDPSAVADRLEEELARVGLPLGHGVSPPLGSTPLFRFVAALAALPQAGFTREDVLAALASRYLGASAARSAARLARTSRRLGVRELAPGGEGLARVTAAAPEDAPVLVALVGHLGGLMKEAPLGAHAAALARLLVELGVGRYARAYDSSFAARPEDDLLRGAVERALGRDQAAAALVEELLARTAQSPHPALVGFPQLADALADVAAELTPTRPQARAGVVRLVGATELAGRRFAHLFLAGLVDGAAPARAREDGLYGDRERRALNRGLRRWLFPSAQGSEAAAGDRTPFESLYLLQALASATETAHVSWSRTDGDRACLRSPFVDELCRVAPRVPIDAPPPSPVPHVTRARAPRDVMMRVALEQLADPAGRVPPPEAGNVVADLAPPIARAAGPRWARLVDLSQIERRRLSVFAGLVPADEHSGAIGVLPSLSERLGGKPERPLPAGSLDRLANCGFQFFAERVLRARPADEAEAAPSRLDLGSLAHRCLEIFYKDRAGAGALPVRADEADRAALARACAQVFAAEARRPKGSPLLWTIAADKLTDDLWRVVENEAASGAPGGGVPTWFELAFGANEAGSLPALALGDPADPLFISGRIDRVDRGPNGLMVLDYKLGRATSERHKLSEKEAAVTQLQLPIYAAAARAALAEGAPVDAVFLSLRDAIPTKSLGEVAAGRQLRAPGIPDVLFDRLSLRVGELGAAVRRGEFHVAPVDCRRCQFKTVCRVVMLNEDDEDVPS
jgi:hypothetical protein